MEKEAKKHRCGWCGQDPLYQAYHDQEWGVPVYDDQELFEFLILETMQAGLSWITILRKRENYRAALDNFDVEKIANYTQEKQDELLLNAGIIRNKLKIKSIITNAQLFLEIQQKHGSFSKFVWSYVNHQPITNHWKSYKDAPANTPLSDQLSKDLKKMGFKFVGSTIMYAFMQATGMVNDHETTCYRYDEV
ncbi:DNA-3-methyladenine glycosylase I [Nonlabens sp. Hel1_33_55]|uniref:DNA-3-methyladenine glycosylase I n=1 Tax=Nonlabens sp. Hel1_33_55 TaxID=1336802 RepID=UPI000875E297|nr:DNA-3-methyladenine glycosylase I [Nonlabens sp. Hel1_33_55]SCY37130.1 DNA-3-methyladenine glycosylase I [Nonlabens sp. Hel1_33_55]